MATRKTVVVTEEGNKIIEAGDIVTEDIAAAQEIEALAKRNGKRPREAGVVWQGGKPLDVTIAGIKKTVSKIRKDNQFGDMDNVLPSHILARRKRLVLDRLKQERQG